MYENAAVVEDGQMLSAAAAGAGVTTEDALLSPDNKVHPDVYTDQLPDLLSAKKAVAA